MTQSPTSAPLPPGTVLADDGVPVFGAGEVIHYEPIRVLVHPDGGDAYQEAFEIHTEADAGAIMDVLSAKDQLRQGIAIANLLRTLLRNDDGVPAEWSPALDPITGRALPARDDEGQELHGDDGPLYRDWTGGLVSDPMLIIPGHEDGSSRRRFADLMDDPTKRVPLSSLTGIAQWVVTRAGATPTRRPQPSTTTSQRRGAGSKGRRPARV